MKKFGALIICLFMILTCCLLGGCAGFSVDEVKYYNTILATVGDSHITRYDLLTAYNSYGYNYYVSNKGQTEEEALASTLDLLIDREAMYLYTLDNEQLYKPTSYQVNEVIKEMFTSLDSEMNKYKTEAKSILNIESTEIKNEETKTSTSYAYSDYVYKKRAKLVTDEVSGEQKIVYNTEKEPTDFDRIIEQSYLNNFKSTDTVKQIKETYFNKLQADLAAEEGENAQAIYSKMISLLTSDLIEGERYLRDENGKEFSKDENATILRYISRIYEDQIKSQYLENLQTVYLNNETLSISELKNAFNFLVNSSADQYANENSYKEAMKNAGTDADKILYHPELTDGTEFGYFIHTLVKFSDEEKAQLDGLKETDPTEYARVMGTITSPARKEDGTIDAEAEEKTISEIITEYNLIKNETNYEVRLEKFIQFMFKYTEDTATLSAGMPYVVGTNGYTDLKDEFKNSAMETVFTKESLSLMEQEKGSMSEVSIQDIENRCITSYGIHFVFYVGNVKDFYLPNADITIEKLYNTTLNPLTHETYFDMLFDKVYPARGSNDVYSSNTNYDEHEEVVLKASKAKHKVVKYASKIKATKIDK